MWIPKKKFDALEKRVTDLESRVQSQPKEIINTISQQMAQRYAKFGRSSQNRFGEQV